MKTKKLLSFALVLSFILTILWVFTLQTIAVPIGTTGYGSNGRFIAPIGSPEIGSIPIYDRIGLESIKSDLNGKYHLGANIDLSDEKWTPIDDFGGTLDGQGYTINGLFIPISDNSRYAGLFGRTTIEGVVLKNIGIHIGSQGVSTHANYSHAGGLIGVANGITIQNCYVTGNVSANAATGNLDAAWAGGLVGSCGGNKTRISNSYTTGNISSSARYNSMAGGLLSNVVGSDVKIYNCYSSGNITSNSITGGLIGYRNNDEEVLLANCYSTGNVSVVAVAGGSSGITAGGLIGRFSNAKLINCYATGSVSASGSTNSFVGGILGNTVTFSDNVSATNCYRLSSQTITGNTINGTGIPIPTTQMQNKSSFTDWDFDKDWDITPSANNGYPFLRYYIDEEGNDGDDWNGIILPTSDTAHGAQINLKTENITLPNASYGATGYSVQMGKWVPISKFPTDPQKQSKLFDKEMLLRFTNEKDSKGKPIGGENEIIFPIIAARPKNTEKLAPKLVGSIYQLGTKTGGTPSNNYEWAATTDKKTPNGVWQRVIAWETPSGKNTSTYLVRMPAQKTTNRYIPASKIIKLTLKAPK